MHQEPTPSNLFDCAIQKTRAEWDIAFAQLKTARDAFNTGAVVRLREILQGKSTLEAKLQAASEEFAQLDNEFKTAFEATGFEKTAVVQKILNKKNDATAITEVLQSAVDSLSKEQQSVYLQANDEARAYDQAHRSAFDAYGRMQAFAVLEEHGQPIADALALLLRVRCDTPGVEADLGPSLGYASRSDNFVKDGRMAVLINLLKEKAMSASDPADTINSAIGAFDISPIRRDSFLGPAVRHRMRVEAEKRRV